VFSTWQCQLINCIEQVPGWFIKLVDGMIGLDYGQRLASLMYCIKIEQLIKTYKIPYELRSRCVLVHHLRTMQLYL